MMPSGSQRPADHKTHQIPRAGRITTDESPLRAITGKGRPATSGCLRAYGGQQNTDPLPHRPVTPSTPSTRYPIDPLPQGKP